MRRILVLLSLLILSSCAAKQEPAAEIDFPIQILDSVSNCNSNTCVFAAVVQLKLASMNTLVCDFKPNGMEVEPIVLDTYERPKPVVANIVRTVVSKTCRTSGLPNNMDINCGQATFTFSTSVKMDDPAVVDLVYRSMTDALIFRCFDSSEVTK